MENKQQSAVWWLAEQLFKDTTPTLRQRVLIEEARAMEKEEHRETWLESRIESKGDDYIGKEKTFEEYYKETYVE
jgi:hypothetical protein